MTRALLPQRRTSRLAVLLVAVAGLAAPLCTGGALGALSAQVDNTGNSAASATLLFTHSYASQQCTSATSGITDAIQNVTCSGGLLPASVPGSRTDSITASGTVPAGLVTESAAVTSCGTPALANRLDTANPSLPRYGTTFATTGGPMSGSGGAITLDGATPGGYAASVVQQSQPVAPGAILTTNTYGLGIWFKAAPGAGGALFGFGSSPVNVSGSNDRILYLTSAGKLGFVPTTGAAAITSTGTATYNDSNWHFAYVRIDAARVVLSTNYTVTVYVDGTSVATGTGGALTSYTGYWHIGWSPLSAPPSYFAGSLSNFVVFDDGNAPTTLAGAASQTAFDSATSTATEHWRLNDDGFTTTSVAQPVIGSTSPCSYADITWGFTTPTSCAYSPTSTTSACTVTTTMLSTIAGAGARTVATVVAGTAQTSTITLAKDTTYSGTASAYLPGLIIYAPHAISFALGSTAWRSAFAWAGAGARFVL